jgi:flagellar protein FliJ
MVRRDNLRGSANDLKEKLAAAKDALSEAFEELKKVEILDDREKASERAVEAQREQAEMDRIGLGRPQSRL